MRRYWMMEVNNTWIKLQRIRNGQILQEKKLELEMHSVEDGYIVQMDELIERLQPLIKRHRSYRELKVVVHSLDTMRRVVDLRGVRVCEVSRVLKNHMREYIPVESDNYQIAYHILEEYPRQSGVKIALVAMPELLLMGYESLANSLKCNLWQVVSYWDVMAAYTSCLQETKASIVLELESRSPIGTIITGKGCVMVQDLGDDYACATLEGVIHGNTLGLESRMLYHLAKLVAFCESMQKGSESITISILDGQGRQSDLKGVIEQEVSADIQLIEKHQDSVLRGLEQLPLQFLRTPGQKQIVIKYFTRLVLKSWCVACLLCTALGINYGLQRLMYEMEYNHLAVEMTEKAYMDLETYKRDYAQLSTKGEAWSDGFEMVESAQWLSLADLDCIMASLPKDVLLESVVIREDSMNWVVKGNEKRVMQDYIMQIGNLNEEWDIQTERYASETGHYKYFVEAKDTQRSGKIEVGSHD